MLIRHYRRLVNTFHIDRAFRAAGESREKEALDILDRKVRNADSLYYVRLLKGQLYEKAGRTEDALREYVAAHALISRPTHLSGVEKAYLETFAAVAARRCAQRLPGGAMSADDPQGLRIRIEDINLRLVAGQVKAQFPLPEHPEWARVDKV